MGWLIAAGVLTLLAILPIGVSAIYNADGPRAYATIGPVRISLYPGKPSEKKEKKPKTKKKPTKQPASGKKKPASKGGSLQDFFPLVDLVLDFVRAFGKKLRITCIQMKLILAGEDPADLAVNYGKAWTALGNLMPLLENSFVIKKRQLEVECDFLAEKTTISARVDLSVTVGRILSLLTIRGIPILRELLKIMNKRKGGAKA